MFQDVQEMVEPIRPPTYSYWRAPLRLLDRALQTVLQSAFKPEETLFDTQNRKPPHLQSLLEQGAATEVPRALPGALANCPKLTNILYT